MSRIAELGLPLPDCGLTDAGIVSILSVAYQASLLRDEDRALSFRLGIANPSVLAGTIGPPHGPHALTFSEPRPLTVHELRKLAPSVKFQRSLVGVTMIDGHPRIWGVIHTGPRWLRFAQGGRGAVPDLPESVLVVHAASPGEIIVSFGAHTIARLSAGELGAPMMDVFRAPWLPAMFATSRSEIQSLHERAREAATEPWAPIDIRVVSRVGQNFLRRIIATIRAGRHGGGLVFLPPSAVDDFGVPDLLDIKYRFADDEPRRRFRTIILEILRELARLGASVSTHMADYDLYELTESPIIAGLDEAIFELAHLIAALSDVDGMVVMTQRFEVLGFGAVVSGRLPEVPEVQQALDLEGSDVVPESTHTVGTRHRAAYRLASAIPNALAVVVSQDANARFVRATEGGRVTYWDQIVWASFGR